jgi:hypothetical protein
MPCREGARLQRSQSLPAVVEVRVADVEVAVADVKVAVASDPQKSSPIPSGTAQSPQVSGHNSYSASRSDSHHGA